MAKQGEVKAITTKDAPEFKGEGEEVKKEVRDEGRGTRDEGRETKDEEREIKKTSVITMQNKKAVRIYFEDGKQVKVEPA